MTSLTPFGPSAPSTLATTTIVVRAACSVVGRVRRGVVATGLDPDDALAIVVGAGGRRNLASSTSAVLVSSSIASMSTPQAGMSPASNLLRSRVFLGVELFCSTRFAPLDGGVTPPTCLRSARWPLTGLPAESSAGHDDVRHAADLDRALLHLGGDGLDRAVQHDVGRAGDLTIRHGDRGYAGATTTALTTTRA